MTRRWTVKTDNLFQQLPAKLATPGGNMGIGRRRFLADVAAGLAFASSPIAAASLKSDAEAGRPSSSNQQKLTFPMAAAFLPRAEQLFPSERWLKAVASAGYTHLFLQMDPFYHPEANLSSDDEDGIWLLTVFSMTAGPLGRSYQAWLGAISEAASRYGLKMGMELWEPNLTTYARQALPADWRGPAFRNGSEPLCVTQPAARAWLLNGFRTILQSAPAMNAIAIGTIDNNANLCDDRCPRCHGIPIQERFGTLYRDIQSSCRQVRPDFELIPYDWDWPEEYFDATFSKLAKSTPLLTRLELGATVTPDPSHPEWHGTVDDQSLGCDQVGPGFRKAGHIATKYDGSVLVMFTLSGMFEAWQLPYIPAAGLIANKFDLMRREKVRGWVDYDCGGIHEGLVLDLISIVQHHPASSVEEWLRLLADERYGSKSAAATALETWKAFDDAVRSFPAVLDFPSVDDFSGRFGVAMGIVPMHPFLPERAREAKDARQEHFWFDPHNFLAREAVPPVRHCLRRALGFAETGLALAQKLVSQAPSSKLRNAEFDRAMAELTVLSWKSVLNFYEWAAFIQGDKSVPVATVLREEIDVTQRFRGFQLRSELEIGNMTHAWQRAVARSMPRASGDFYNFAKSAKCELPRRLADIGDYFGWKIAGLQEQLREWA